MEAVQQCFTISRFPVTTHLMGKVGKVSFHLKKHAKQVNRHHKKQVPKVILCTATSNQGYISAVSLKKHSEKSFTNKAFQSINVYLYSPISQMFHLSQWTSQFVQNISMTIRHPLSLHRTRNNFQRKTPQFKGGHGRNLRESIRGGIPLPGRTDVQ